MVTYLWKYDQVHEYLQFVKLIEKFFRDNPEGKIKIFWSSRELDYQGWRAEFRKALDLRINHKVGLQKGRKYSFEYQISQMRDCTVIRGWKNNRLIVRQLETKELKKRFSHIFFQEY